MKKFIFLAILLGFSACANDSNTETTTAALGTWTALSDSPLTGRKDSVSVWTGSKMVIWGGDGLAGSVKTGALYDPATDTWSEMSDGDNVPSDRTDLMDFVRVWTGDRMIVWSGRSSDGEYSLETTQRQIRDDGGLYDPETDSWTPIQATSESPGRAYIQGIWTGDKMIVWAGHDQSSAADAAVADPSLGAVYDPGDDLNDPSDDIWRAIATANAPSQRRHAAAVWTGSRLLTWGGAYSHQIFYNDGALYDPDTDAWTEISDTNAPSPRELFAYVWTGSKLLVWGGFNGTESLDDGAIYDPQSDTWSAIATLNAPQARTTTSVVWTGEEMLVWGGLAMALDDSENQTNTYLGDGAAYNPTTNIWRPLAEDNAPSARRGFFQVWTGTQLLIWGGYNGEDYFNDGAALRL